MQWTTMIIPVALVVVLATIYYVDGRIVDGTGRETFEQMGSWLLFSVLFALLPIVFNIGALVLTGQAITSAGLLSNGELFIVGAGLSADALGRLTMSQQSKGLPRALAITMGLIALAYSSFLFAVTSTTPKASQDLDSIIRMSIMMFSIAMIASANCVWLSRKMQSRPAGGTE